eukprot:gene1284-162_t
MGDQARLVGGGKVLVLYAESWVPSDFLCIPGWHFHAKVKTIGIDGVWSDKSLNHIGDKLVAEIRTGYYNVVFIDDNMLSSWKFDSECSKVLRCFFNQGGTVIVYYGSGADSLPETFNKWFGTNWHRLANHRVHLEITEAGTNVFGSKFQRISVQSNVILDAPKIEKMWKVIDRKCQWETNVPVGAASVLVHSNDAGGRVAFFGDVNFQRPSLLLMQDLCTLAVPELLPKPEPPLPEHIQKATRCKLKANLMYKTGKCYDQAAMVYANAIEFLKLKENDTDEETRKLASVIYSNRAQACLMLDLFEEAAGACEKAQSYDNQNTKAMFRYAKALRGLAKLDAALDKADACVDLMSEKKEDTTEIQKWMDELTSGVPLRPSPKQKDYDINDVFAHF